MDAYIILCGRIEVRAGVWAETWSATIIQVFEGAARGLGVGKHEVRVANEGLKITRISLYPCRGSQDHFR